MDDYRYILAKSEYGFLREFSQQHHISYLTIAGSRSYGTNHPDSDIDVRGFFMENPMDLYGLFPTDEVFVDTKTDTTLYSFKKFITLLMKCNPNVVELLGTLLEHKLLVDDVAQYLLKHQRMFLSKLAYGSFFGYATAQLRRLENALAHDAYTPSEREVHLKKSIEAEMVFAGETFKDFDPDSKFELMIAKSQNEDMDDEIYVDCAVKGVPIREFLKRNSNIANTIRNYGKLTQRNHKKDAEHLNKHAMHLIRLYLMGLDILENAEICTYRDKEHDLLTNIRNGQVPYKDIFKMADELKGRMDKAYASSTLPDKPDFAKINRYVVAVESQYMQK